MDRQRRIKILKERIEDAKRFPNNCFFIGVKIESEKELKKLTNT